MLDEICIKNFSPADLHINSCISWELKTFSHPSELKVFFPLTSSTKKYINSGSDEVMG